jgi:hypothetical protein
METILRYKLSVYTLHPISLRSILMFVISTSRFFLVVFYLLAFAPKSYIHFSSPHTFSMSWPSQFPWLNRYNYIWRRSTIYKAPHYAVFFKLLLFHPPSVQIFSSALCSQTPSVYILRVMSQIKVYTHSNVHATFVHFIFIFSDSRSLFSWMGLVMIK